jgi:hypothetical protein
MKKKRWIKWGALGALCLGVVLATVLGTRGYRMAHMARDFEAQIRYMLQNNTTIGAAPAANAFSDIYLEAIFGDNPELLEQLRTVVRRGLERQPDLDMGEVAGMIVTYRLDDESRVTDVAAHVVGGFPLGRMSPQFHRHGFFRHQIDENLWNTGNTALRFLGRDMVLFAGEELVASQMEIIEGILRGDIIPLVNSLEMPIYYTAVLPDPRRMVPPQLRHHVQAMVLRGMLAPYEGRSEVILLTTSPRSANYTMSVMTDLKRVAEIALKTKFKGVVQETDWGPMINPWWSYEMVQTSERAVIEREENIVRMRTQYERVMVNAVLKTMERFGRDWNAMRLTMEERMDPREVDRIIATRKPLHYWSEEHRWGPDWPIAPSPEELEQRRLEQEVRRTAADARRTARIADQAEAILARAERAHERAVQAAAENPELEPQARRAAQELEEARQQVRQTREEAQRAAEEADRAVQELQQALDTAATE